MQFGKTYIRAELLIDVEIALAFWIFHVLQKPKLFSKRYKTITCINSKVILELFKMEMKNCPIYFFTLINFISEDVSIHSLYRVY